jgi:hypothetical protein
MIARHDVHTEKADIWSRLAEPLPNGVVYWRQDGKPITRDGKHFARFVAYIEANTARERLDAVVPGEWDLTLELLPPLPGIDEGGDGAACSFKARLQILGVIREDVGTGRDYKAAAVCLTRFAEPERADAVVPASLAPLLSPLSTGSDAPLAGPNRRAYTTPGSSIGLAFLPSPSS